MKKLNLVSFITTEFVKVLVRLVRFCCCFLSVNLLILGWTELIVKRRQSKSCRRFLFFVLNTVMIENAVPQRYVVEKQRKNLTDVSCKFGYSFYILIQNFKLLIELKVLSSPLSDDNSISSRVSSWERVVSLCSTKGFTIHIFCLRDAHVKDNTFQTTTTSSIELQ